MRKVALLVLVWVLSVPAMAQDTPHVEVFGGFSYARVHFDALGVSKAEALTPLGFHVSATEHMNSWFGGSLEISGHYKSPSEETFPFPETDHVALYTVLFGPRFSYRRFEGVTLFAHSLIGVAHVRVTPEIEIPSPSPITAVSFPDLINSNAFAAALGGGIDLKINDTLAVRPIQVDYLVTRFKEFGIDLETGKVGFLGRARGQHNLRLSTGIVLRFGRK